MLYFILFAVIGLIIIIYFAPQQKIKRLASGPFPAEWVTILQKSFPLYHRLPDDIKEKLHREIQIFIGTKQFIGQHGIEITEQMRLCIAAQACLLIVNKTTRHYPKLKTIIVYPSAYIAEVETYQNGMIVIEEQTRLGESWDCGMIVLAWDAVYDGALSDDGHNVVFHEFAHRLDQEDGRAEGYPLLGDKQSYIEWEKVFGSAFKHLCERVEDGKDGILRAYGSTNPAEFFAVATEAFFEKPNELNQSNSSLYSVLKKFYNLDPLQWTN